MHTLKCLENLVRTYIRRHLTEHRVAHIAQHGFLKGRSACRTDLEQSRLKVRTSLFCSRFISQWNGLNVEVVSVQSANLLGRK